MHLTCFFGSPDAQFCLLVDDRVDRHRGLAGLAVADDQLALAAADGGHGVDGLDAGLHRLLHRLALHDRGRLQLEGAARLGLDRALAVDRVAQRVDDAAEVAVADRDREDLAGAADLLALLDAASRRRGATTPISRTSRFSARPSRPPSNSSSSLVMAECRPSTRAMPSPVSVTRPTSSRAASGAYAATLRCDRVADLLRPDRQLGHGVLLLVLAPGGASRSDVRSGRGSCWSVRLSQTVAAGLLQRCGDAAVDDLVADPHRRCRRARRVDVDWSSTSRP